jgi:hypothetical protein
MMDMELPLKALQNRVNTLEKVVQLIVGTLGEPVLRKINSDRGFRYEKPDIRHFCVLKAVRVVSALNASIALARGGYTQEIGVLMRTVAEFATHIEFVLDPGDSDEHRSKVKQYVEAFFADTRRDPEAEIKKAQVPQGTVHASLGKTLDKLAEEQAPEDGRVPAAKLYSNIYRIFSNYVHGKYPEIMDCFGGRPGRFHLRGMSGTPKDFENLATLDTFITTASNSLVFIIQGLGLRELLQRDQALARWYLEKVEG